MPCAFIFARSPERAAGGGPGLLTGLCKRDVCVCDRACTRAVFYCVYKVEFFSRHAEKLYTPDARHATVCATPRRRGFALRAARGRTARTLAGFRAAPHARCTNFVFQQSSVFEKHARFPTGVAVVSARKRGGCRGPGLAARCGLAAPRPGSAIAALCSVPRCTA